MLSATDIFPRASPLPSNGNRYNEIGCVHNGYSAVGTPVKIYTYTSLTVAFTTCSDSQDESLDVVIIQDEGNRPNSFAWIASVGHRQLRLPFHGVSYFNSFRYCHHW
jgi:hypothetical protein